MPTKKQPAPLAHYAAKDLTPTMVRYVTWLKEQTGYDVDPLSVQLSGVLRPMFQAATSTRKKPAPATPARPRRRPLPAGE